MANRRSLALRRNDASVPLRPPVGHRQRSTTPHCARTSPTSPRTSTRRKAILHVRDLSYTEIEVAFDPTQLPVDPNFGAPTEVALVRSPSGFPATLLDGIMVRRHPPTAPDNDGWVRIPDTGLTPGHLVLLRALRQVLQRGQHALAARRRALDPAAPRVPLRRPPVGADPGVVPPRRHGARRHHRRAAALDRHRRLPDRRPPHVGLHRRRRLGRREDRRRPAAVPRQTPSASPSSTQRATSATGRCCRTSSRCAR